MAFKSKNGGPLARLALTTQEYGFTITYRKGIESQNADALSRQFEHVDIHSAATSVSCQFIEDVKLQ